MKICCADFPWRKTAAMGIAGHVLIQVVIVLLCCSQEAFSLCEVETGEAVIILDIAESKTNETDQHTHPATLPIKGNLSDIQLEIIADSENIFVLNGKQLKLKRPLDRDLKDISFIHVQIKCTRISTKAQRTIPLTLRVIDVNDNAPKFIGQPYETSVSELSPVGTTIFRGLQTSDADSSVNSLVEYFVVPGNGSEVDGFDSFSIDLPYQGFVTVRKPLDYEKNNFYQLIIIAADRATKLSQRLTSTTTLTIHVTDDDDQDPAFVYDGCAFVSGACVNPEYSVDVISGKVSGILNVLPKGIKAIDQDQTSHSIIYSFSGGSLGNFTDYFKIDSYSGVIRQTNAIHRSQVKNISIIIKAEEISENRRFATARLNVIVKAPNNKPPVLHITSVAGFVDENSPVGTIVTEDRSGQNGIHFNVTDEDLEHDDLKPKYEFELTTDQFIVNKEGYLVVNDPLLDRDSPNRERCVFQIVARESGSSDSLTASAPLTVTVHLNDLNDNAPEIDPVTAVTVSPSRNSELLTQLKASDSDDGDNAKVMYSLYHVSNDGHEKFRVSESGAVQSTGPLEPGRQYSLTVQASDKGGRVSHRILDVYVEPSGRIVRPSFSRQVYDVRVNEGIAPGSVILSLSEAELNGDFTYDILDGNTNGAFILSPTTGALTVRQPLDREKIKHYALGVRATDKSGQTMNATVNVDLTDINDCNPEFLGQPYVFYVDEGLVNVYLGRVKAVDADEGPNGVVYYSVPSMSSVTIDSTTGEIRTRKPLDFETQPMELAIVTAQDGARNPRIATATVTIVAKEVPDELPLFSRRYFEGTVPENIPNMDILQVTAYDADEFKQITYVIRDGPVDRFSVDPVTGVVRTIWPLDYEENNFYSLIIGTRENFLDEPDATCMVRITVLDRNDVPPRFTVVPSPLRLQDTMQPGTSLATVQAMDSDGTPPNNLVKYSLGPPNSGANYFDIHHDTGVITLKGDLSRETSSEIFLIVNAYDLGSPQLTASATFVMHIDHVATLAPEMGIAFPDASYTVEVEENSMGNIVIKTLPVINKPTTMTENICEIERGNELDHFYVRTASNGNCELRTKGQKLDYETKPQYQLIISLNLGAFRTDPSRSTTEVNINVKDTNDNSPVFQYQTPMVKLIGKSYVAAITRDAPALTPFTKITAIDYDSGSYGKVDYGIVPGSDPGGYFVIDHDTGLVSSSRTFEKVQENVTLFKLRVMAMDNPKSKSSLNSTSILGVNLISDDHRLVLVILDSPPEKVAGQKGKLTEMLQDNTNLVINIEKIESRKYLNQSKIEIDSSSTDVWFNVIDPKTLEILPVEDQKLSMFLSGQAQERSLLYAMSSVLNMNVDSVRVPLIVEVWPNQPVLPPSRIRIEEEMDGFQAALIALACIIAILGTVGIIYVCFIWSRYSAYRARLQRLALAPRYEPVLVEPNLKPYETQVLQMNVQLDDNSSFEENGVTYDFKGNLDNVSYITRDTGDGSTLALGNASLTESDSFEGGSQFLLSTSQRYGSRERAFQDMMSPAHNPVYHSSDENAGSPFEGFAISSRRRGNHVNLSPVATTTEL